MVEFVTGGVTNIEIADRLNISVVTVKLHRGQVMEKMQADTLAHLVRIAERLTRDTITR